MKHGRNFLVGYRNIIRNNRLNESKVRCVSSFHIFSDAYTSKGKIRANNEDGLYLNGAWIDKENMDRDYKTYKICDEQQQLYAVCDGMGGEESGELASFAVVSNLDALRTIATNPAIYESKAQEVIGNINQLVYEIAVEKGAAGHCGTTLSALVIIDNRFLTINIGDSRVYLFRHGRLHQLTKDHTEVQRMIDMGFLKEEDARTHPKRHIITRHLGMNPENGKMVATLTPAKRLHTRDVFLLCSDGLYDMISNSEIQTILRKQGDAEMLANAAMEAGGNDNVTAIKIAVNKRYFIRLRQSKDSRGDEK